MGPQKLNLSAADRLRLSAGTSFHPGNDHEIGWLAYAGNTIRLNETAVDILRRCNGEYTVAQLIDELTALYEGTKEDDIASGVRAFLDLALSKGWVDLSADLG
jgi:pyrroloquinoline quinone biosynthesis protein D